MKKQPVTINSTAFDFNLMTSPSYMEKLTDHKIKCKCGHSCFIPNNVDRIICDWCGNYCYRKPELEFRYKLNEKLLKLKKTK